MVDFGLELTFSSHNSPQFNVGIDGGSKKRKPRMGAEGNFGWRRIGKECGWNEFNGLQGDPVIESGFRHTV